MTLGFWIWTPSCSGCAGLKANLKLDRMHEKSIGGFSAREELLAMHKLNVSCRPLPLASS